MSGASQEGRIGRRERVGSRILAELVRRGQTVTSIARDAGKVPAFPGVDVRVADATRADRLAPAIPGHDAVISATRYVSSDATSPR